MGTGTIAENKLENAKRSNSHLVTPATSSTHIQHFWSHSSKICTVTLMSPSHVISP